MRFTYAQVARMHMKLNSPLVMIDSGFDQCYIKESETSSVSSKYDFMTVKSLKNFSENWTDNEKMGNFLDEISLEIEPEKIVDQVVKDWIQIYSEISFKGIGSDSARWVCVKRENDRFYYQKRPSKRTSGLWKKTSVYKTMVLDESCKIFDLM